MFLWIEIHLYSGSSVAYDAFYNLSLTNVVFVYWKSNLKIKMFKVVVTVYCEHSKWPLIFHLNDWRMLNAERISGKFIPLTMLAKGRIRFYWPDLKGTFKLTKVSIFMYLSWFYFRKYILSSNFFNCQNIKLFLYDE